jgi:hypothetical protein
VGFKVGSGSGVKVKTFDITIMGVFTAMAV